MAKRTLAIVSTDIRRDLIVPLREMNRLHLIHCYRKASYGDLVEDDLDASLVRYRGPLVLFHRLMSAKPDVIQGVEPFAVRLLPYLYAVLAAALLLRVPLVLVTLENRPLGKKHGLVFSRLLRIVLRPVLRYATLVIYLNEGAKRNVLSVGRYEKKLRRMMYGTWGVDLAEFTPDLDGREPQHSADPVLLFVGRLHEEKGVFELLEAFRMVKPRWPAAKLVIAGSGPALAEIEQLIHERELGDDVILTGTVKNRDLPPYFRAADLFLAPSVTTRKWEEQVGMTNIQAMACGVPVVSTKSGAIPEYVPDGLAGLLVPERDPAALAAAVLRLLSDDSLRQKMSKAARSYATEHYDAKRNVLRAEETMIALLGSH